MRRRIAIVYNAPYPSRYDALGETKAVLGVLEAVAAVQQALLEIGHQVVLVPLMPPLEQADQNLRELDTDLVFNLFEGFPGDPETEAMVPEVLSARGIHCTGCNAAALRLALDKAKVKIMMQAAGVPTPDFQLLNPGTLHLFRLGYPCIVKPSSEDASHGLSADSIVNDGAALAKQVGFISNTYKGDVLVEEFIDGREFNATVLGNSADSVLPVSEIAYALPAAMPRLLTFSAKWEPDSLYFQGTKAICPADVGEEERQRITETALAAFELLGGEGYARVDMRADRTGRINVIEVNPNPDISPGAGAILQAAAAGMTYTRFIQKIVELALEK
ncbi:MAG: ATP-grasp domain-containing protein [Dehalococcoidales bacterium]|nr:ATP-grasp domain-containing protein [Dehalococcoidales bacterium]